MATVMHTTMQLTSTCCCGAVHVSTHQGTGTGTVTDQAVAAAQEHFEELRGQGWRVVIGEGADTVWDMIVEAMNGPSSSFSVHTICPACA